jgi:O-antigen/teichoic acid export membrane protein
MLGVTDYGIYNVVGGVVALFGFLNSTLASGTQRFLTFQLGKNDFTELKKTFSAALNIHLFFTIVILILAETVGLWFLKTKINIPTEREYAALWVYQFSIFAALMSVIRVPYNASIIAHERMNVYAYVSIIDAVLQLLIVYLLSVSGHDKLIVYAVLIFVVNVIVTGIYCAYCKKQYQECRLGWVKDKRLYQSMLSFSGWNIFGCGAVVGATQGVNVLLNLFFGPVVNAARGIAVQVSTAIAAFVNNFQTAVNPQIVKLYAAGEIHELHKLILNNSKFSFCVIWILSLPVLLNLETLLHIWLVEVPEHAPTFCRLIILQSVIYCTQRPLVIACHAVGKMRRFILTITPALLLILPVSYFLLDAGFPAYIPFVVYIVATVVEYVTELYLLKRWIGFSYRSFFCSVLCPIFVIATTSLPLPFLLCNVLNRDYISFFLTCTIAVLNVCASVCFFAIDKTLREKLYALILTKIKSLK